MGLSWIVLSALPFVVSASSDDTCYPPGGVAGIVVATVIVTCVVMGLAAATAWKFWWTPKRTKAEQESERHHQPPKSSADYAFDNPYFRNQEGEDATGKSKSSLNKNSLRSSKGGQSENSSKGKKGKKDGRNHFVFGGGKKQKALDDTCLATVERTFVNLRGHDFTGLGFNICGNMRDGILVKDVLHRGPASESGLIKAGDKIVSVTVSFTNIVYEDALTILSYASPYDVQLEIERTPEAPSAHSRGAHSSPNASSRQLGSCSFSGGGHKLFHPLYRSQSIDDLTQIDRGADSAGGAPLPGGPRRSQSVGVAAHKLAKGGGDEGGAASRAHALSATGSLNEKMLATVMQAEGAPSSSKSGGPLQLETRFEDTLDESAAPCPPEKGPPKQKDYLDAPPPARMMTLETRMILEDDHPRQRALPIRPTPLRGEGEENDSDVSKDSLEVGQHHHQRAYQKRGRKGFGGAEQPPNSGKPGRTRVDDQQQVDSKSGRTRVSSLLDDQHQNDSKSGRTRVSSLLDDQQIDSKSGRTRVSSLLDDQHQIDSKSGPERLPVGYKQRVTLTSDDNQVVGVALSSSSSVVNGGGPDENVDRNPQKFQKKTPTPAGGMFTQINPFQMPSKQRQPGFKPRTFRDEPPNGDAQSRSHGSNPGSKQTRTDASGSYR